jgi:hypothetical protein
MRYTLTNWQDQNEPRRCVVVQVDNLDDPSQVNDLTNLIVMEVMIRIRGLWDWDAPMNRFYIPTVSTVMDNSYRDGGLYMPLNMIPKRDGADLYILDFLFVAMSTKIRPIVEECVSLQRRFPLVT